MKEILSERAKEVFGSGCEVVSVERLLGGAQKHVWMAVCADGFKFAAYQWDSSKTYFGEDFSGPFCSSSAELFELNNRQMTESGVLTPKLYNMDRSRTLGDYELALVEYIDGADMDHIMEKEPERLDRALGSLRESIERLHSMKSPRMGQLGRLMGPEADPVELELADMDCNARWLQENDPEYAPLYAKALQRAESLAEGLARRGEYTFIHRELGPNHVIVDRDGRAYLIDIEGAGYADAEEENSFLKFRFNGLLTGLSDNEDPARMSFYHTGHCFGNLRGAVELREKGYYDMDDVNGMIRFFHSQFEA